MADDSVVADGQKRSAKVTVGYWATMAHGVDAVALAVQPPRAHSVSDSLVGESDGDQLPSGDPAVLPAGDLSNGLVEVD